MTAEHYPTAPEERKRPQQTYASALPPLIHALRNEPPPPSPASRLPYVHWANVRLPIPLDDSSRRRLRAANGGRVRTIRADPTGRTIRLSLPTADALAMLPPDAIITSIEIALDWIFDDPADLAAAEAWLIRHHWRPRRRAKPVLFVTKGTHGRRFNISDEWSEGARVYPERKTNPQRPIIYRKEKSPILKCEALHTERRLTGNRATSRVGLGTVADLIRTDWRAWWAGQLHLATVDISDPELRPQLMTTDSVQTLIDALKKTGIDPNRKIIVLDNSAWLPNPRRRKIPRVRVHESAQPRGNAPVLDVLTATLAKYPTEIEFPTR